MAAPRAMSSEGLYPVVGRIIVGDGNDDCSCIESLGNDEVPPANSTCNDQYSCGRKWEGRTSSISIGSRLAFLTASSANSATWIYTFRASISNRSLLIELLKSIPSINDSTLTFALALALKVFFTLSASEMSFHLALASVSVSNFCFFFHSVRKCSYRTLSSCSPGANPCAWALERMEYIPARTAMIVASRRTPPTSRTRIFLSATGVGEILLSAFQASNAAVGS